MYHEHYGLTEPPFSITPDPRFVFLSERHRDALAHLLFGIGQGGGGGFVQLTGEVGTGKTTLSRLLLEQLPENTRAALVLNPRLSPVELLETVCEELHIDLAGGAAGDRRGSLKALVDALNAYLLDAYAQGLRVVLIIDEAQNLSRDALEQVRLLTNLETDTQKLLQIILIGQPELRTLLARPDMRQLAQRITARYHLTPLSEVETGHYLRHRYRAAGGTHFPFTAAAVKRIHAHAGGVPRLINVVAERALLGGYASDRSTLDERWVDRAAREALAPARNRPWWGYAAAGLAAVALAALALWWRPAPEAVARAPAASVPSKHAKALKPATPVLDADAFAARVAAADPSPLPATRQLLAHWQVPADAAADAATCAPSPAPGLYCLRAWGGLDKIAAQGRPVLLRLRHGDREAWALLLGADAVNVRLWLAGATFDTDRIALERVWRGDYLALWRAPAHLADGIPSGTSGPASDWVRERLAPQYLARDAAPPPDASIRDALRRFQAARGLASDGVVGPETLMALAARDSGPRLQRVLD
ncbi:AAA family ATPase [Lysobacter koreensis]|uniref:AAA family ATPase n=1 Tax=Lysobacter koreensis TaxID=266122 RepID=A0ABW2YVH0_9GAMM